MTLLDTNARFAHKVLVHNHNLFCGRVQLAQVMGWVSCARVQRGHGKEDECQKIGILSVSVLTNGMASSNVYTSSDVSNIVSLSLLITRKRRTEDVQLAGIKSGRTFIGNRKNPCATSWPLPNQEGAIFAACSFEFI